jgi:serine/threonine protein kinase
MEKSIKQLLREGLETSTLNKKEFFIKNNIDHEELHHLGSGDFGEAYSIGDGRVLKITSSKSEFNFAKELVGKNFPALDGFVDFYDASIVEGEYYIIMEELEEGSGIEDLYYQVEELLNNEGLPIQYLHYLDTDEMDLDEDVLKFINDMDDINHSYRYLGIEASDIKPDNLGVDKNGKIKAFDIDDRSINEENKPTNEDYLIGYKVMPIIDGKISSGANKNLELNPTVGEYMKMHGNGIYLSLNKRYVLDYYSELADEEVLITFKFKPDDIITGKLTDKETEISVSKALVNNIEYISNE